MKRFLWLLALLALVAGAQESPAPANPIEERLQVAYEALEKGDYEQAIQLFEDVVAEDWRNYDAHFGLGLAYLRSGNLKEAWFEFKQLTKLYPERFEAWYNLGVTQAQMGDWQDAARSFERALKVGETQKLPPETLRPAYLALAEVYRKLEKPDRAAEVLKKAHRLMPDDEEITLLLADALVASGRLEDAIPYLYDILAKDRGNVSATILLADVLMQMELPDRALREIDRSLEAAKNPKDRARLLYKKALILAAADGADRREIQRLMEEALKLDPTLWQAHYDVGRIKLAIGDAQGALRSFLMAYRENPDDPRVLIGLAAAYDALGRASEAYRTAKLALAKAQGPDRLEALFLLGKSAYFLGKYDEAVDALRQVVEARKNDADAWYWLGLAYYARQDYGQAVLALERAAQLDNRIEVLEALGAAYLASRRFADAERVFSEIVQRDPRRASAWYHLGWALKALGREAEAKRAWQKAYQLGYKPAQRQVGSP